MRRIGVKQLGLVVGAMLTAGIGCGVEHPSDAADLNEYGNDASRLELAAKLEQPLIPEAQSPDPSADVCASDVIAAESVPVNLYLMIDRSGSMQEGNKWGQSMAALRAFVEDPSAEGLRVALRFFGDAEPVVGCSQQECSIEACARPLVPSGELSADVGVTDTQETTLVQILERTLPLNGFGTPIYPALGGALAWATDYKSTHTKEKVAVVFVTDGEPNGCDTDMTHISGLASDAFAKFAVPTFAIGLEGSNEAQMDQIAKAGQTQHGIFIGRSAGAETQLLDALNTIRSQAMSCDFVLPVPATTRTADTNTVNLVMQTLGEETQLYRADSLVDCKDDGAGWYFDDNTAPTRIHLCPSTCTACNETADTQVSIVMGCVETRREPQALR